MRLYKRRTTLWNNLLLSIFLIVERMRNQRRIGEALTIAGGIGISIVGMLVSVPPVSYAGLCVLGLGVVSIFWR